MAADPPPTPDGHPPENEPRSIGGPTQARNRRRLLVGRVRTHSPLPAIEIARPETDVGTPPRPEVPARSAPIFDGILALAVLVLAALLASFAAANADLWMQLAAGRLIAHGQFPFGADPFSAVPSTPWINHAWLFDLLLYALYQPGGAPLVAVKAGFVVAMTIVLLALRRPGGRGLGPAAATTLVLLAMSPLLVLRSPVASYLLFAALLWILHRRLGANGRWQLPTAIFLLFVLWVNLDGGFMFGLLLLATWTVGAVLQAAFPLGDGPEDSFEPRHPPGVLAVALLAAVIACLLNPYHFRVFHWPTELTALSLPNAAGPDPFMEQYLRDRFLVSPLSAAYVSQVGPVAAWALYLLLAGSLLSFALNSAGWRWRRVLAWTVFACLGTSFGRMVPYFALVAGPAIVLNVQAFLARRRMAAADDANPRLEHVRAMLAAAGRTGLLLMVLCLLALAWPGWLGADTRTVAAPTRRVAWRAAPDPTQQRLAERLAAWYQSGDLHEGEDRGFHLQPDFAAYCAWFCPAEKGFFDTRLTAPPEVIADYLALRRAVTAMGKPVGPEHPGPPDPLLRKYGITHLVLSGAEILPAPPGLAGPGEVVFADRSRFTPWAIEGRGVICGWRNPHPKLRLDAVRLAVGDAVVTLPDAPEVAPPSPPSFWERYKSAFRPAPAETFESGMWLADHDASAVRGNSVATSGLIAAELARLAPLGPPVIAPPPSRRALDEAWARTPEGRANRAATLLAIRTARRAILANPQHPQTYARLAQAYGVFQTDPSLEIFQELTSVRQALTRYEVVAAYRPPPPNEGLFLQNKLFNVYQRVFIPETQARPDDLMLEALTRSVELRRAVFAPRPGAEPDSPEVRQFEREEKILQKDLEQQANRVRKQSDDYENSTPRDATPKQRAKNACRFGLVREALNALLKGGNDLDLESIQLMANLFLLCGEAENARDVLQSLANSVERMPPQRQIYFHYLTVHAAAALGDYSTAIEHCDAILAATLKPVDMTGARILANMVFPDAPGTALSRVLTLPLWNGDFFSAGTMARQHSDWCIRQGILALEQGDLTLARRQLTAGLRGPLPPETRAMAQHWLELWHHEALPLFR